MSSSKKLIFGVVGLLSLAAVSIGAWKMGYFGSSETLTSNSKKVGSLKIEDVYKEYKSSMGKDDSNTLKLEQFKNILFSLYIISSKIDEKDISELVKNDNFSKLIKKGASGSGSGVLPESKLIEDAVKNNKEIKDKFFETPDKFCSFIELNPSLFKFELDDCSVVVAGEQFDIIDGFGDNIKNLEKLVDKDLRENILKKSFVHKRGGKEEKCSYYQISFANWLTFLGKGEVANDVIDQKTPSSGQNEKVQSPLSATSGKRETGATPSAVEEPSNEDQEGESQKKKGDQGSAGVASSVSDIKSNDQKDVDASSGNGSSK